MGAKQDDGPCEVYGIRDGEHGVFHYIGMSHSASGRWEAHLRPTYETRGGNAVRRLEGRARLVVLSRCSTPAQARTRERKWSHRLARWGHPLLNIEAVQCRPDLKGLHVNITLPTELWKQLRIAALEDGTTASSIINREVQAWLDAKGRKQG